MWDVWCFVRASPAIANPARISFDSGMATEKLGVTSQNFHTWVPLLKIGKCEFRRLNRRWQNRDFCENRYPCSDQANLRNALDSA